MFLPVLLLYRAGELPAGWVAARGVAVVLLSSAYGFARHGREDHDHFFTGFPSYWNIVVALPATSPGCRRRSMRSILLVLSALVFVRIGYVYPSRTPVLRGVTIARCVWLGRASLVVDRPGAARVADRRSLAVSLVYPVYYIVLRWRCTLRRPRQVAAALDDRVWPRSAVRDRIAAVSSCSCVVVSASS